MSARGSIVVFAVLVVLAACKNDPDSTRGVAELFLDAHYVNIDLTQAEGLVAGVASEKLAKEKHLVGDQQIDEGTRKPTVHYRLVDERPDGENRSRFIYRATFTVEGAGRFERQILLVLRREPEGWKVVNFEEFE
jgi:hypothetical protein